MTYICELSTTSLECTLHSSEPSKEVQVAGGKHIIPAVKISEESCGIEAIYRVNLLPGHINAIQQQHMCSTLQFSRGFWRMGESFLIATCWLNQWESKRESACARERDHSNRWTMLFLSKPITFTQAGDKRATRYMRWRRTQWEDECKAAPFEADWEERTVMTRWHTKLYVEYHNTAQMLKYNFLSFSLPRSQSTVFTLGSEIKWRRLKCGNVYT